MQGTLTIDSHALFLSLATFVSTCAGGLFALRYRDRLHYILSFTAGVLMGVVSFDDLPRSFELTRDNSLHGTGEWV